MIEKIDFNTPFKLFADCIPVKGFTRSIIVDISRKSFYSISNNFYDILIKYDGSPIKNILKDYDFKSKEMINDFFLFLLNSELIFFTLEPQQFSRINFSEWKHPSKIYQAIIDIGSDTDGITKNLFLSLDNLNCKYIQIRFFRVIDINLLEEILLMLETTSIVGVDIFFKFKSYSEIKKIESLCNSFGRVNNIVIYGCEKKKQYGVNKNKTLNINLIKQEINGCLNCGLVSRNYFSINIDNFTLSKNFNSCLYKKISIDISGNIKNCPSMKESFGNLKTTKLETAILEKSFTKHWGITKDKIKICQDCEFRYICTDCRAYTEDPNDLYSKPLKCGYNPYTGEWEEWSKNVLKKNAINFYGLNKI